MHFQVHLQNYNNLLILKYNCFIFPYTLLNLSILRNFHLTKEMVLIKSRVFIDRFIVTVEEKSEI